MGGSWGVWSRVLRWLERHSALGWLRGGVSRSWCDGLCLGVVRGRGYSGAVTTVASYLADLPADRRAIVKALRSTIRAYLDPAVEEGIQYGMIGYFVPHSVFPSGYHCDPSQPVPYAGIGNQKGHVGLYLFCAYVDEGERERFVEAWEKTGCRLDMGASCVRIKTLDQVPLKVVGAAVRRMTAKKFLKAYEASVPAKRGRSSKKVPKAGVVRKRVVKKGASKKAATKKAASKTGVSKAGGRRAKVVRKKSPGG